ncbi:MAG: hypothetical protein C6Y22_29940, partial [Hapalosiphonaceae cyanobacterium JJU2]
FVRNTVEADRYAIRDADWKYADVKAIIPLRCPEGHIADKSFSDFQQGTRCAICSGKAKHTSAFVRNTVEADRYAIRDADWEYVNNETIIPLFCPNGHMADKSFASFQQGRRCAICYFGEPTLDIAVNLGEARSLNRIADYIKQQFKRQSLGFNWTEAIAYLKKYLHPGVLKMYAKSYEGCHIDHIVPASWFDLTKEQELHACFDPGNLRVIPAVENLSKRNRLTLAEATKLPGRTLWALSHASYRPRSKEWDELARQGAEACLFLNKA